MQRQLFCVLFVVACMTVIGGNCHDEEEHDLILSELSADVQADLITFSRGETNFTNLARGCIGGPPDTRKVKFYLYDKENVKNPVKLDSTNLDLIDKDRPIVFIIHGWLADAKMIGIPTLRNAYLKEDKSNVIVVDWSWMSQNLYTFTVCYVPYVAEYVAEFILEVSEFTKIPLAKFHLVGHSLGAHMSGQIGKSTYRKTYKDIGRISGLDPAGPLFQTAPASKRLRPTDAAFVEVIHSNAGMTGFLGNCGTVDYHLNCGSFQPLCIITREGHTPGTTISTIVCDHLRSMFVWAEAVNTNQFKGKGCKRCPGLIIGTCSTNNKNPTYYEMGGLNPPGNNYNVPTYHSSPFAKGCAAYPQEPCA